MSKTNILVLLFLLLVPSAQFGQRSPAGKTPSTSGRVDSKESMIDSVQRKHIVSDLGCRYFLKSDPTRVVYYDDFGGNIWMNIDGQDVKVKLIRSLSSPRGQVGKGRRTISSYVAPGVKIGIDTVVTRSEYEGSEYAGILTVTKGSRQQKLKVVGSCNGG